jgi:hypothetical protein
VWLNDYEVTEVTALLAEQADEVPNLYAGARVLYALRDWTNDNSDGWPYWQKPAKAAKALMEALHQRNYAIRFGHDRDGTALEDLDLSPAQLTRVLAPIKAFLTRQGVDYASVLPFAAIL